MLLLIVGKDTAEANSNVDLLRECYAMLDKLRVRSLPMTFQSTSMPRKIVRIGLTFPGQRHQRNIDHKRNRNPHLQLLYTYYPSPLHSTLTSQSVYLLVHSSLGAVLH